MSLNNFGAIKKIFDRIDTTNKSCVRTQTCIVIYETNVDDLNFTQNIEVTVNISSRDYYSIEFNGLDVGKYHTYFDSRYQNFNFTSNCLTIKGTAFYKDFQTYKIKIYIS